MADDEDFIKKQALQRQILSTKMFPKAQVLDYVLSIRNYKGKKPTMICLYTSDEQYLVMSAAKHHGSSRYNITTNSLETDENSLFFVGISEPLGKNIYLGYTHVFDHTSLIPVAKVVLDKTQNTISLGMPAPGGLPYLSNGTIPDGHTEIIFEIQESNFDEGSIELVVSYEDTVVFRLKQTNADEFTVTITNPLSLFTAMTYITAFLDHIYYH